MARVSGGKVAIDGTYMQYVRFGSGKKNVIILPGLSDGLATVKGKALLLSYPYREFFDEFTIYMFSRKDDMPDGYSIEDMADDQAAVLRSLGIEKTLVLGVSEGGMIAQVLASRYPEMTESAVLAVTAPYNNDISAERIHLWRECAVRRDHKALMIDTAEHSYSESYLKKYRKMYPIIGFIGKPKDYSRFLINVDAIIRFDARKTDRTIKCPVLIIGGKEDKIVGPDASYELHDLISGSVLYMYEGLGHAAYEEAQDFNDRAFSFMRGYDRWSLT